MTFYSDTEYFYVIFRPIEYKITKYLHFNCSSNCMITIYFIHFERILYLMYLQVHTISKSKNTDV